MGKISFLFSGQGAQVPGLGRQLAERSPAAAQVFTLADSIRPGTSALCFEGTQEELNVTINTQPAVFCADLAAADALVEAGIRPDFCAGFSLGEVAALTFAGAFSREEGFRLVCRRAELMQQAAQENPGAMAAVLRLSNEQVEQLCAGIGGLYPVNYNCPGQLVVAGSREGLDELAKQAAPLKGRVMPLAVSGAFHSPMMDSAAKGLERYLEEHPISLPEIPVYANLNAQPYGSRGAELLAAQVRCPVQWQKTLENLAEAGCDTFIEVGVGKTLEGLVKKTLSGVTVCRVENSETLDAALALLKG